MSVVDTIKKSVLENFTGTISVGSILLSLLVAFVIGLFIIYVYKKTYTGVVYSKAFYQEKDGFWEGGSVSQFTPVVTFRLWEKFSDACLEVW